MFVFTEVACHPDLDRPGCTLMRSSIIHQGLNEGMKERFLDTPVCLFSFVIAK